MLTTLYKMMLQYAHDAGYMSMGASTIWKTWKNLKIPFGGYVLFSPRHNEQYVRYPSPEYDAWRCFMMFHKPRNIVICILKNWKRLKDAFPKASMWLDLNMAKAKDILDIANDATEATFHEVMFAYSGFIKALDEDISDRKHLCS